MAISIPRKQPTKSTRPVVVDKFLSVIRKNIPATIMGTVIAIQLPFMVLYLTGKPHAKVVPSHSSHRSATVSVSESIKPLKPMLPSRKDPFALLPGMTEPPKQTAENQDGDNPGILNAFTGNSPITTKPEESGDTGVGYLKPMPISNIQATVSPGPQIAHPVRAIVSEKSSGLRLNGIARCGNRSMAVFQLADKSTVQTFEGERVAGTDYQVKSIQGTRVSLSRSVNGKPDQLILIVGEDARK